MRKFGDVAAHVVGSEAAPQAVAGGFHNCVDGLGAHPLPRDPAASVVGAEQRPRREPAPRPASSTAAFAHAGMETVPMRFPFQTSWEAVYRSVEWFVEWGLAHRELGGIQAIGVDEIHWGRGLRADNFLTVVYQIDRHCRRLLWVGRRRSQATLRRGLKALGPEVVQGLRFVCSDMWKPYLQVIAAQAGQALHVLDRFVSVS